MASGGRPRLGSRTVRAVVDLVIRERFEAMDPEVASEAFRSVFGDGRITADAGPFRFVQTSLVDDGISVSRITCSGTDVRALTAGSPDLVAFLVRSGSLELRRGQERVLLDETGVGLLPLGEGAEVRFSAASLDLVSFPLTSIARLLGVEGRAVRLHAPHLVPLSEVLASYWRRLAAGTFQMLSERDLYDRDLLRGQLVDALTAATIEAFGLSDVVENDPTGDRETMRRALDFMDGELGEPISVTRIAVAAGISVRGLQLLFQRTYGSTPVAHLRRLRLNGARASLLSATSTTTVGSVARRFGYSNLGRFSAHYRDEFAEMPSRTLQHALDPASR
jgi:AraC-like DNA-binding protein